MRVFGRGPIGKTAQTLDLLEKQGRRICETLVLPWDQLNLNYWEERGDFHDGCTSWRWEQALEVERLILHDTLSAALQSEIDLWLQKNPFQSLLVRPGVSDPLGYNWVRGRGELIRAITEARGALGFHYVLTGEKEDILLTLVPSDLQDLEILDVQGSGGEELGSWIFQGFSSEGQEYLADASQKNIPWSEPFSSLQPEAVRSTLMKRVIFGRLYQRVMMPEAPLIWFLLLAGKIDPGRFIDEAKARYGEKIETFLTLGMAQDDTQGVEKPGIFSLPLASRTIRNIAVRQVLGKPGAPGFRIGHIQTKKTPAETSGSDSSMPSEQVYVKQEVAAGSLPTDRSLAAIIEIEGCGFGEGARMAHQLSIPHIYQARQAVDLPDGALVEVDGALGIITVVHQD